MCWSGGKDSCVALHALQRSESHGVRGLLTTITRDDGRISIHGVRTELLERQAAALGLPLIPVWGRDTRTFIADFIAAGFCAILVCVDLAKLDASFAGRPIDTDLLADLPPGIDPCGENGEFHTFVFDGPNFAAPIAFDIGERVIRDGFAFCDLLPA